MADGIEEEIADEAPVVEEKVEETPPDPQEPSEEEQAKQKLEQDLIDLGKAKTEALAELSRIRTEKQSLKKEDDELPKIDLDDPSAKAWDKRIQESAQPIHDELEKARAEVRDYALQKFLQEKPALARDPEKVKQLMGVYDRLHTASERTVEGVLTDLQMSYGALTYKEQEVADQQVRIAQAQSDAQFSEAAISRGSTGYQATPAGKMPKLTDEERDLIRKQGWTPEEWWKAKQEQASRA